MNNQETESREELKKRLRDKIKTKSSNRQVGITKKKGEQINDSLKKISSILQNKNIETVDQIDSTLIETFMSTISINDLELIVNKMKEESKFKEILNSIKDKMKEIN